MATPVGLRQAVRALPPEAWVLFAGTFVNRFGSFVLPFLVLYLIKRGYSTVEAGAVVSLYAWNPEGFWSLCAAVGVAAAGLVLIGREPVRAATG